ncbi:MAG: cytochrome P460 [Acidobacteria bacterium]|nr:MAG: cytochrome P460 [Acidobacteriota bacterium]
MPMRSKRWVPPIIFIATVCLGSILGSDKPVAQFEGKDTLLRPAGYREWVFVGSSLGLRYDEKGEEKPASKSEPYHNVYINPAAYHEFSNTGKFPEGTIMILELASAETKQEPGLQGSYQKDYVALAASVKDSKRFEDGWAYFGFTEKDGKPKSKAKPFPSTACWSCHHQKAATDHVFTQFYPVLRAVMPK